MRIFTQTIALTTATPVQVTQASTQPVAAPGDCWPLVSKIYVEPLAANAHTAYVGVSSVAAAGTGVISELVKPAQVSQQSPNHWSMCSHDGGNRIDITQFYFVGTTGDSIKVSFYVV
jgi:hypothetical protein